jgi:hypothetical protein
MISLDYFYRRRHLDGSTGITITGGEVLAQRDDAEAWVFDGRLAGPRFTDPVTGRRGTSSVTILRPTPVATRLWLWPDRPLRMYQYFDAAGDATIYRVDFATYPRRHDHTVYQTDLYLDLFATHDERDYAILDEDELAIGQERGLVNPKISAAILAQADELVELLEHRQLGVWLASWCDAPFDLAALSEHPERGYREHAPGEPDGWPEEDQ